MRVDKMAKIWVNETLGRTDEWVKVGDVSTNKGSWENE